MLARHRRVRRASPTATLRCPAPLRSSHYFHVVAFVACDSPCFASGQPAPHRFAILLRSRTGPNFHVWAFATVLLTHVLARRRRPRGARRRLASCYAAVQPAPFAALSCSALGPAATSCGGARHGVARPCAGVRSVRRDFISRRKCTRPHPPGSWTKPPFDPLLHPCSNLRLTVAALATPPLETILSWRLRRRAAPRRLTPVAPAAPA